MNFEKNIVSRYEKLATEVEDEEVLIDFVESGESSFENELIEKHKALKYDIEEFEVNLLLDGEYDMNNAIVTIHSGAGGTEACDWADMLYRMYLRWCNLKNYKVSELDFMEGDSVGVKSVTFLVEGINAYGYLKSEKVFIDLLEFHLLMPTKKDILLLHLLKLFQRLMTMLKLK